MNYVKKLTCRRAAKAANNMKKKRRLSEIVKTNNGKAADLENDFA